MGGLLSYLLGTGANNPAEGGEILEEEEEDESIDVADPATGLTPRHKRAIQATWSLVQPHMKATGVALLILLFEDYPEHQLRFPAFANTPLEELENSKKFAAHASSVMHAVASLVDSLDDTECLVELLKKIGQSHAKHAIPGQAFWDLKEVLLKLLKDKLGKKLTPVAEEGWDKTLSVANTIICQHLKDDDEKDAGSVLEAQHHQQGEEQQPAVPSSIGAVDH